MMGTVFSPRNILIFFFLLLLAGPIAAQKLDQDGIPVPPPKPLTLVYDYSAQDFLTAGEESQLSAKLQRFSDETSNQIVIVIVDDLNGFDASSYSFKLGERWGVGQGKFDNGIVILIKPTGGAGQRDIFIAVGDGLEAVIPDATAFQVQQREIIPLLKEGKNYEALDRATDALIGLAKKEFNSQEYAARGNGSGGGGRSWKMIIIGIIIVIIISRLMGGGRRGGGFTIGRRGGFYGGFGGFGGGFGGGSFGGGGGGGWGGGFGGGSFGGGGAGGKW
jgi:uncharacterized protein